MESYQMVMPLFSPECHLPVPSYSQEARAEGSGTGALESPSLWKVKVVLLFCVYERATGGAGSSERQSPKQT